MDIEAIRDHCLAKEGVTEGFPFGEDVLVFKVMSRMFALVNLERIPTTVNLKCDPERAVELRERYGAVEPGWHMNKQHWNTLHLDGTIPSAEVRDLIDHSYELVVQKLTLRDRETLGRP